MILCTMILALVNGTWEKSVYDNSNCIIKQNYDNRLYCLTSVLITICILYTFWYEKEPDFPGDDVDTCQSVRYESINELW